ncbi:MAG TPA: hypothetical protein HA346_04565 [Thermoplasmata archaeon]|nr:hypothetical protein [Thermoplasmata archaeon]
MKKCTKQNRNFWRQIRGCSLLDTNCNLSVCEDRVNQGADELGGDKGGI